MLNLPTHTPWGAPQDVSPKADSIVFFSTAGHGGYWLDSVRFAELKRKFPDWVSFGGNEQWFEEDSDICAVVIAFSDLYDDQAIFNACRSVAGSLNYHKGQGKWKQVYDYAMRNGLTERAAAFRRSTVHLWERGGCFCGPVIPDHKWQVIMRRGEETREYIMPYPEKQCYSDEELANFTLVPDTLAANPGSKG